MSAHADGSWAAIFRIPANLSRHDLSTRAVIAASAILLAIVTGVDLIDGKIGPIFTIGYLMVSITAPLAVKERGLYTIVLMPPVLLLLAMLTIASLAPASLVVEGLPEKAGVIAHAISATVERGGTLLLAQAVTIVVVLLRILGRQNSRKLEFYSHS